MKTKLIQSYVYCDDKAFFVSTINRESSAMETPGATYAETMVWEWFPEGPERGAVVHIASAPTDSIRKHLDICDHLYKGGTFESEVDA